MMTIKLQLDVGIHEGAFSSGCTYFRTAILYGQKFQEIHRSVGPSLIESCFTFEQVSFYSMSVLRIKDVRVKTNKAHMSLSLVPFPTCTLSQRKIITWVYLYYYNRHNFSIVTLKKETLTQKTAKFDITKIIANIKSVNKEEKRKIEGDFTNCVCSHLFYQKRSSSLYFC